MIDFIMVEYIYHNVHKSTNQTRKGIREVVKKINTIPEMEDYYVVVTVLFLPYVFEANSLAPQSKAILVSARWIIQLLLYPNKDTINAFRGTLGHELTHKEGFLMRKFHSRKELSFIRWCHEVYCDFGSAKRMFNFSREKLIKAIDYKIAINGPTKIEYPTHPSWERRKEYATYYDFTQDLIQKIAEDTSCENKELISSVQQYFAGKEIRLDPVS